jgi:dihydrofolate reductase
MHGSYRSAGMDETPPIARSAAPEEKTEFMFYSRKAPADGMFLGMAKSTRRRKFIVYIAVSADGFIARPDGSVDWLDGPNLKGDHGMGAFYRSIDTCVLGRKTYDVSVKFGMADGYAGKKNFVFSRTLSKVASPKVSVVSEDVTVFAERLRSEKGKDIWLVGGAELVAAFLDSGQVDEFIIHLIPTMIGEGIPLVAPRHRDVPLKLLTTKRFPDGVVRLHYAVRRTQ